MANDVTLNLRITGDGSGGKAAIDQVIAGLNQLKVASNQATGAGLGGVADQAVAKFKKTGDQAKDTGEKISRSGEGFGKVEHALQHLLFAMGGVEGNFGRVASAASRFALGGPEVIAVAAGVALIGSAWEKMSAEAKEAQKATDDLIASLIKEADVRSGRDVAQKTSDATAAFERNRQLSDDLQRQKDALVLKQKDVGSPGEAVALAEQLEAVNQKLIEANVARDNARIGIARIGQQQKETNAVEQDELKILAARAEQNKLSADDLKHLTDLKAKYTAEVDAALHSTGLEADKWATAATAQANLDRVVAVLTTHEAKLKEGRDASIASLRQSVQATDAAAVSSAKLSKAQSDLILAQANQQFGTDQTGLEEQFNQRQRIIEQRHAEELAEAEAHAIALSKLANKLEGVDRNSQAAKDARRDAQTAATDLTTLIVTQQGELVRLQTDRTKSLDGLKAGVLEFQRSLLEAEGKTLDAALLGIDQQVAKAREALAGKPIGEVDANTNALRDALTLKAHVDDISAQATRVTASIRQNEQDLQRQVAEGLITSDQATQRQRQFITEHQGQLLDLIAKAEALSNTAVANPELFQQLQQIVLGLQDVQAAAHGAKTELQGILEGSVRATGNELLNFLDELVDGTHSVSEAFADLARNVVRDIAQIVAQVLIAKAIRSLLGGPLGFQDGGPVGDGGETSGIMFAASGGRVPGSGRGDTVPAMLEPGEFVLSRRMIDALGGMAAVIDLVGHGSTEMHMRGPSIAFADGGIVPVMGERGSSDVNLLIDAHPDLIVKHIESGQADAAIVKVLHRKQRTANTLLGRR